MIELRRISFCQIKEVWATKLWPGRKSPIEPVSILAYAPETVGPKYDMSILDMKEPPFFVAAYDDDTIVGVNSGFLTGEHEYRSRGLYVDPSHRGRGIAKALLCEVMTEAVHLGADYVWTMPRKSAYPTYEKVGFVRTSYWFEEGVEFGPNCYARATTCNSKFAQSITEKNK